MTNMYNVDKEYFNQTRGKRNDVTSGRACAHDHFRYHHTAPPQMITGWCLYTTDMALSVSTLDQYHPSS
jgi:hypothetical protein